MAISAIATIPAVRMFPGPHVYVQSPHPLFLTGVLRNTRHIAHDYFLCKRDGRTKTALYRTQGFISVSEEKGVLQAIKASRLPEAQAPLYGIRLSSCGSCRGNPLAHAHFTWHGHPLPLLGSYAENSLLEKVIEMNAGYLFARIDLPLLKREAAALALPDFVLQ